MPKFSEHFSLDTTQAQLDFVDIDPNKDTPLFIDPFAISIRDDAWSAECHQKIRNFFQSAINYIKNGNESRAKDLLNKLSEPNETCLGLSSGRPAGRGVAGKQAIDLYDNLARSQAARSGILEELAECDLFVQGIGPDKISDITTNIIRDLLIRYTQNQCELHGIKLNNRVASGRYWNIDEQRWVNSYEYMPIIDGKRIILTPKSAVRRAITLNSQEYYNHFVVNFLQQEEFGAGSSLVRVLKSGERRPPTKKSIKSKFPFSKDFLARMSNENPQILKNYKKICEKKEASE